MAAFFRSLRSGSSANCLLLWTDRTTLLIDCGIKSQCDCDEVLRRQAADPSRHVAAIVSHAHGDHLSYAALRFFQRHAVTVHCHELVARQVVARHAKDLDSPPAIERFGGEPFEVGEFHVTPVPVLHEPGTPTFAWVIRFDVDGAARKIVVGTDFYHPSSIEPHLAGADFVFVESNHDPELLRLRPNYASRFHMSNARTAAMLRGAAGRGDFAPRAVMLGHLSLKRNTPELAINAVRDAFAASNLDVPFPLYAAPGPRPSDTIELF